MAKQLQHTKTKNGFGDFATQARGLLVCRLAVAATTVLFVASSWRAVPVSIATFDSSVKLNPVVFAIPADPQDKKAQQPDTFERPIKLFIENVCCDCHTGSDGEAGVDLARFKTQADVDADLETWSRALKQIESGSMPPGDSEQLNPHQSKRVTSYILKSIAAAKPPKLAKLRRLNRVEYENTIRELFRLTRPGFNNPARIIQTNDYFQPATGRMPRYVLAVSYFFNSHRRHSDLPGVSSLPVDPPVEHGFANDQDALSLSPLLVENYFEISTALLGNVEFKLISDLWGSMFQADERFQTEELVRRAHEQVELFLPRAFRRPATQKEVDRYQKLFESEYSESDSYTEAMKTTIATVLVSPKFLFRNEFAPLAEQSNEMDAELARNFALANRLSFFLWASMPDDELFQAARERRLTVPMNLERQVDRMMQDPRVKSLATDFGMQWLKVQKASSVFPERSRFPEYYAKSKMPPPAVSMMIEQLLFFEAVMIENRDIREFIQSDFSFLNRQLMDWYQVDPKQVLGYTPAEDDFEDFFRIKWPNSERGGVISSGAMLISTSTTTRTSPVYRGAWILDVIFNSPPPPAPADIPPLVAAEEEKGVKLNVRQKLAVHREDAACASCHDRIDPMGFALEMFDGVGRKRTKYATGEAIDSSGFVSGEEFVDAASFKEVILKDKKRFVKAFVEHTMKYALGRQLHYSDMPEIDRITEQVLAQNCRFRSVIKQVVLSELFGRFDEP